VRLRTSCKDQVHGVLAKLGITVTHSDIFGAHGQAWLDELSLPQPYAGKVGSLRQLAGELSREIGLLELVTADLLERHDGYAAIQALPGIGPVLAAVIVAEIGDITRFRRPEQLCCRAGLTPRHYESDTKVIRGHVTKQGSRLLRWAVIEAIQRQPTGSRPRQVRDAIIARRGNQARNIAAPAWGCALGPIRSRSRWYFPGVDLATGGALIQDAARLVGHRARCRPPRLTLVTSAYTAQSSRPQNAITPAHITVACHQAQPPPYQNIIVIISPGARRLRRAAAASVAPSYP
jgi:hypothetical protein